MMCAPVLTITPNAFATQPVASTARLLAPLKDTFRTTHGRHLQGWGKDTAASMSVTCPSKEADALELGRMDRSHYRVTVLVADKSATDMLINKFIILYIYFP
jgi:hypothetical protein